MHPSNQDSVPHGQHAAALQAQAQLHGAFADNPELLNLLMQQQLEGHEEAQMTDIEFQNKQKWLNEQLNQVAGDQLEDHEQLARIAEQVGLSPEDLISQLLQNAEKEQQLQDLAVQQQFARGELPDETKQLYNQGVTQEQMNQLQLLEQQQMLLSHQRVQDLQLEFLKHKPDLTAEQLQALIEDQLLREQLAAQEQQRAEAVMHDAAQLQLNGGDTHAMNLDQIAAECNLPKADLEQLLMAEALQTNGMPQEQIRAGLGPEGAALLEQAQAKNLLVNGNQVSAQLPALESIQAHNTAQSAGDRKALSAGDKLANASQSSSVDSEQLQMFEKKRDQEFARQLRLFYKSMSDTLSKETMVSLSRDGEVICQQIDETQRSYIALRRQMREQRLAQAQNPMSANQPTAARSESSSLSANDVGPENDGDSAFKVPLYGPDSQIDPDAFIKKVLSALDKQPELQRQFKRFLPDDDPQEQEAMQHQLAQLESLPQPDEQRQELVDQLKHGSFKALYELLQEYEHAKSKKSLKEALDMYGEKIMAVAENYQKYIAFELEQKLQEDHRGRLDVLASQQNNQQLELIDQDIVTTFVEQLGHQMELILNILPQEVLDNFSLAQAGMQVEAPPLEPQPDAEEAPSQRQQREPLKPKPVGRKKLDISVTRPKVQQSQKEVSPTVSVDDKSSEQSARSPASDGLDEWMNPAGNGKLIGAELGDLPNNINKAELHAFEQLQRQLRSNDDWHHFVKTFMLYQEGIISQVDFMAIFHESFAPRLKSELRKELEILLPSRDNQRRAAAHLLKPWNELDSQRFSKIHDSSYFKIADDFPMPICSAKVDPENNKEFSAFLNDRYLSLSMGTENFKFKQRSVNEDMIFKNEDEMYKLDTQIENFRRCERIVGAEIGRFNGLSQKDRLRYEFPRHKFRPLMFYWEKQYRDAVIPMLTAKNLNREDLEQLRSGLGGKLTELVAAKYERRQEFEDVYRRNYVKSLDHRSFQYNKDFMKAFQQKPKHLAEIRSVSLANQMSQRRHPNLLKGGNIVASPYCHSFGPFLKSEKETASLIGTNLPADEPMNMSGITADVSAATIQKLPHQRFLLRDSVALQITCKIVLLHIFHSQTHSNADRPKLVKVLRRIVGQFLRLDCFEDLVDQCGDKARLEHLHPGHIELVLNVDSHLWYKNRVTQHHEGVPEVEEVEQPEQQEEPTSQRVLRARNTDDKTTPPAASKAQPIKIQLQLSASEFKSSAKASLTPPRADGSQVPETESDASAKQQSSYDSMNIGLSNPEDSIFVPHYTKNYGLLFAPINTYMFVKFFHALYERICYAKVLVREKIDADLAEMSHDDKVNAKICDTDGKVDPALVELFFRERYEHLLKGIFATTSGLSHGGGLQSSLLGSLHIGYSHNHHLMDHNKYEDFSRQLLGKNAFLLFQIDKVLTQAVKQLAQMPGDTAFQRAMKLMSQFDGFSERQYLAQYAQQLAEQMDLAEFRKTTQGRSGAQPVKPVARVFDGPNHLSNESTNLDMHGQFYSLVALHGTNFQVFRLLWSPVSSTLAVHYINFNPHQFMTNGSISFGKVLKQNHQVLHENTVTPIGGKDTEEVTNTLGEPRGNAPIFLRRNLKHMQKHRNLAKMREQGLVQRSNTLTHCIMPRIGVVTYDVGGEDSLTVKRQEPLEVEARKNQDVRKMCQAAVIRGRKIQQTENGSAIAMGLAETKRRRK